MSFDVGGAIDLVRKYVPQYRVVPKKDSRLMWFIGKVLFFNKDWERYSTTIGFTTYSGSSEETSSPWLVFHEGLHAVRAKRMSRPLFYLAYLFPFLPIPYLAVPRFLIEREGYKMNMLIQLLQEGEYAAFNNHAEDWYTTQLSGSPYFFMIPPFFARREVWRMMLEVKQDPVKDPYWKDVVEFIRRQQVAGNA